MWEWKLWSIVDMIIRCLNMKSIMLISTNLVHKEYYIYSYMMEYKAIE